MIVARQKKLVLASSPPSPITTYHSLLTLHSSLSSALFEAVDFSRLLALIHLMFSQPFSPFQPLRLLLFLLFSYNANKYLHRASHNLTIPRFGPTIDWKKARSTALHLPACAAPLVCPLRAIHSASTTPDNSTSPLTPAAPHDCIANPTRSSRLRGQRLVCYLYVPSAPAPLTFQLHPARPISTYNRSSHLNPSQPSPRSHDRTLALLPTLRKTISHRRS